VWVILTAKSLELAAVIGLVLAGLGSAGDSLTNSVHCSIGKCSGSFSKAMKVRLCCTRGARRGADLTSNAFEKTFAALLMTDLTTSAAQMQKI